MCVCVYMYIRMYYIYSVYAYIYINVYIYIFFMAKLCVTLIINREGGVSIVSICELSMRFCESLCVTIVYERCYINKA